MSKQEGEATFLVLASCATNTLLTHVLLFIFSVYYFTLWLLSQEKKSVQLHSTGEKCDISHPITEPLVPKHQKESS